MDFFIAMENLFELFYETSGICTDTRSILPDSLFICLKGANFNGNTFAKTAIEHGAKYVICDEDGIADNERIFQVSDSLHFLQRLAHAHRMKFDIPLIGITGSNGKTSTKELINSVLSQKYNVLATKGNLNNHIGVPLTLLQLNDKHSIAIIEMGANAPGEIDELCKIAHPNYGIITNIGKAHLEGFQNFEGVLKTKKALYSNVDHNRGTIIYNIDDLTLQANVPNGIKRLSFGTTEEAEIKGNLIDLTPEIKMEWSYKHYQSGPLETQMIGKYNFYNFLAAITFGVLFDLTPEEINQGIQSYTPSNNRSQVTKTESNTLIMDCYNANPTSMRSALESFAMINHPNKKFIIGDMLELGEESQKEHQEILSFIQEKGLTGFTVGPLFMELSSPSLIHQFDNAEQASEYLNTNKLQSNLILLKGSRGIKLETLEKSL